MAHGPIERGTFILHRCDNPACCNAAHLRAGTHEDNMAEMVQRGRSAKGEAAGRASISTEVAEEIFARLERGERSHRIAATLSVGRSLVCHIKNGRSWTHLRPALAKRNA